ncbi:MAG: undecaprenyl-diphosphate phosphatase [Solirubrobacterales bacterium]|nr:undecaprenyl-diphosphate phosphatase [Solirubrobacterales bacterium]
MLITAATSLISIGQAIILGFLQGVTELFPVSSLGHTVLFPTLFRWHNIVAWQSHAESPWLAFVVMLHVGSAIGLLIYFWRDWIELIKAFFVTLSKRRAETPSERLVWLLIIATIPVGILGLVLEHPLRTLFAKPIWAAIFLIINGLILIAAERFRRNANVRELARREGLTPEGYRDLDTMSYQEAAIIGTAQSTALIAGISRDGVVMTSGLARGLDNAQAARFAFLMATPPILAAGIVKLGDLLHPPTVHSHHLIAQLQIAAVVAAAVAAVTAVVTVHFLTKYFEKRNLIPFGVYCIGFGILMVIFTTVVGAP